VVVRAKEMRHRQGATPSRLPKGERYMNESDTHQNEKDLEVV